MQLFGWNKVSISQDMITMATIGNWTITDMQLFDWNKVSIYQDMITMATR